MNRSNSRLMEFDNVFGMYSRQDEIFKSVALPSLQLSLQGSSTTIFAYGPTGTGKTFTMEGNLDDEKDWGLIPRMAHELYSSKLYKENKLSIKISYLEIYNEELQDLLSNSIDKKLKLIEDSKKGIICQNLDEILVNNVEEIMSYIKKGSELRSTASTLTNAKSSRSHSIFSFRLTIKLGGGSIKNGLINLVDLAGSENINRSGAREERAREAGSINQSLLALGRVITSLADKLPHVPYRDSKLTRLLQDSLGGKSSTQIIATVSPSFQVVEDTISTLEYAFRARNIVMQPISVSETTLDVAMKDYLDEIEELRSQLFSQREKDKCVSLSLAQYENLMSQKQQQEILLFECESTLKLREKEIEELKIKSEEIFQKNQNLLHENDNLIKKNENILKNSYYIKYLNKKLKKNVKSNNIVIKKLLNKNNLLNSNIKILNNNLKKFYNYFNNIKSNLKQFSNDSTYLNTFLKKELQNFVHINLLHYNEFNLNFNNIYSFVDNVKDYFLNLFSQFSQSFLLINTKNITNFSLYNEKSNDIIKKLFHSSIFLNKNKNDIQNQIQLYFNELNELNQQFQGEIEELEGKNNIFIKNNEVTFQKIQIQKDISQDSISTQRETENNIHAEDDQDTINYDSISELESEDNISVNSTSSSIPLPKNTCESNSLLSNLVNIFKKVEDDIDDYNNKSNISSPITTTSCSSPSSNSLKEKSPIPARKLDSITSSSFPEEFFHNFHNLIQFFDTSLLDKFNFIKKNLVLLKNNMKKKNFIIKNINRKINKFKISNRNFLNKFHKQSNYFINKIHKKYKIMSEKILQFSIDHQESLRKNYSNIYQNEFNQCLQQLFVLVNEKLPQEFNQNNKKMIKKMMKTVTFTSNNISELNVSYNNIKKNLIKNYNKVSSQNFSNISKNIDQILINKRTNRKLFHRHFINQYMKSNTNSVSHNKHSFNTISSSVSSPISNTISSTFNKSIEAKYLNFNVSSYLNSSKNEITNNLEEILIQNNKIIEKINQNHIKRSLNYTKNLTIKNYLNYNKNIHNNINENFLKKNLVDNLTNNYVNKLTELNVQNFNEFNQISTNFNHYILQNDSNLLDHVNSLTNNLSYDEISDDFSIFQETKTDIFDVQNEEVNENNNEETENQIILDILNNIEENQNTNNNSESYLTYSINSIEKNKNKSSFCSISLDLSSDLSNNSSVPHTPTRLLARTALRSPSNSPISRSTTFPSPVHTSTSIKENSIKFDFFLKSINKNQDEVSSIDLNDYNNLLEIYRQNKLKNLEKLIDLEYEINQKIETNDEIKDYFYKKLSQIGGKNLIEVN